MGLFYIQKIGLFGTPGAQIYFDTANNRGEETHPF